jgi:hypothetical protein
MSLYRKSIAEAIGGKPNYCNLSRSSNSNLGFMEVALYDSQKDSAEWHSATKETVQRHDSPAGRQLQCPPN